MCMLLRKVFILLGFVGSFHFSYQHCWYTEQSHKIVDQWWSINKYDPYMYNSPQSHPLTYNVRILCNKMFVEEEAITASNINEAFYNSEPYRVSFTIQDSNITTLTVSSIPDILLSVGGLKMTNIFIKEIKGDALKRFTNVREINLQHNSISSLPDGLFSSNTMLGTIDLSYNSISLVANTTFSSHSTVYLNLGHNKLENLNFRLPQSLENLELSFNSIAYIAQDFLFGMTALKSLSLENNNLKSLPVGCFKDLNKLKILSLARNKLKLFKQGTFTGLRAIQILRIANNSLQNTFGLITHSLESLYTLDIENNLISEIDVQDLKGVLRNLKKINFRGNVLNCTHLKTVFTQLVDKQVAVETGQEYFIENIKGIPCQETQREVIRKNDEASGVKKIQQKENVASETKTQTNIKEEDVDSVLQKSALKAMTSYDNKNDEFTNALHLVLDRIHGCFVFVVMIFVVLLGVIAVVMFYSLYLKFQLNSHEFKAGLVEAADDL